ncbi:MAG: nucleotidyltransferase family protein [Thermodesulfobacteriota bacterium]|nr:nucleotidyltransferase family protein [Thermodesulfobacteriota bacterium]
MSYIKTISSNLLPEMRLLLDCSSTFPEEENNSIISALRSDLINWTTFINLVRQHRVYPFAYRNLRKFTENGVPEHVKHSLRVQFEKNVNRSIRLAAELVRLVELLERKGFPTLSLKGPALALQIYGDLSMRHGGDLDLLVAPEHLAQAERVLLQEGYRRLTPAFNLSPRQQRYYTWWLHHFGYYHDKLQIRVELHHRLFQEPCFLPLNFHLVAKQQGHVTLAGTLVKTLSVEDTVLYLCAHGAKHAWLRLFWLFDIARLLRDDHDIDWGGIMQRAKEMRSCRFVAQGILLSNVLLGTSLPDSVRSFTERDRATKDLVNAAYRMIIRTQCSFNEPPIPPYFLKKFYDILVQISLRQKLMVCVRQVGTIPHDWCDISLPDALFPFYHLLRPFLWFRRKYLNELAFRRHTGSKD